MICIAVVKIWKVVTHLDQVVDYAEDHDKTNLSNFKDLNDLYESIWYRLNDLADRNNTNKTKDNFER